MLALLGLAGKWAITNAKWIVIGMAVIALLGMTGKLYTTIRENGESRIVIATQQEALKRKDEVIIRMQKVQALQDKILAEQRKELDQINEELEGLTSDLKQGIDDPAADSLKDFFGRLK